MSEFINNNNKPTKFAFFGCWNETHYPSGENLDAPCFQIQENTTKNPCDEFSFVLNHLKQKHNDIDFLVVAGDNYYPEKNTEIKIKIENKIETEYTKKTKKFEINDFNKGFEALKFIDKPTYLLLGNHDVDNITPKEKKKEDKSEKKEKDKSKKKEEVDCRIIESEIEFVNVENSKIKLFDYKTELIVEEMQETNTLCIMVDTSIFIEKLDCYAPLLNESDKHWNKEQIIDKQKRMIQTVIEKHNNKKTITNLCFFGHHPLLCLKSRDRGSTIELEDTNMEWNRFLFHVILENDLQKIQNKYYFCADLHHYQTGVITITNGETSIKIKQYIAGTGGAYMDPEIIPDQITPDQITPHHERKISIQEEDSENVIYSSYKMEKSRKENGFLIIHDNPNSLLQIRFYPVHLSKIKAKPLSHLPSSRSRRRSHYLSRRGNNRIKKSQSLGGKTRRIQRKSKKNKH